MVAASNQGCIKVFEPFYTTKFGQGGSGLGMYIAYNIVTGVLGGELILESELEQYTRFKIKLPRIAP
jgi:signal transduction histidine kinase